MSEVLAKFKIFDDFITIRTQACSLDNRPRAEVKPYINLYIRLTNLCQARCKFCEYHGKSDQFDLFKFKLMIKEIKSRKIPVSKVNFTGGEPTLDPVMLNCVLSCIKTEFPNAPTTINTNGYNLLKITSKFDCVALSRHHYLDEKNFEIFGTDNVPSITELKEYKHPETLHFRCNLIKGYIDSKEEILKYINESSNHGIIDMGFVSLMKLNKFCEENFIDYSIIDFDKAPRTKTVFSQHQTGCSCKNFIHYTNSGNLIQLYSRWNEDFCKQTNILVYDINKVTEGFGGKVLF